MTDKPNVFLSHSSNNREIVERVAEELRGMSLEPWLFQQEIRPGDRIPQELNTGLANADYVFIFWSIDAARSRWVQSEVETALFSWADKRSLLIVPVRLDDTELPDLLKPISYMDFRDGVEAGILQLRKFFGREGFGSEQRPRLLSAGAGCKDKLSALRNMELRLLLKGRLALNDVREIWMDTFESRVDDDLPGMPLGIVIGEMILRAEQRRLRNDLLHSICNNRPDIERD